MYVFTKPFSITLLTKNSLRNKGHRGGWDRGDLGSGHSSVTDFWTLFSYPSAKVKSYKKVGSDNVLARSMVL